MLVFSTVVVISNELVKVERLEGKLDSLLVDSQDDEDEDNQLMESDDTSSNGSNDNEKTTTGQLKYSSELIWILWLSQCDGI